jgi:hypothetical protein
MIDRIKELTGVYGLGLERESFLGVAIPVGFVILVGGVGWVLIRYVI